MLLHTVSNSDQCIKDALPNQKNHCSICFNRQREKTPIWEQDYLLIRKIIKIAAIGIACMGTFYCIGKMVYHQG